MTNPIYQNLPLFSSSIESGRGGLSSELGSKNSIPIAAHLSSTLAQSITNFSTIRSNDTFHPDKWGAFKSKIGSLRSQIDEKEKEIENLKSRGLLEGTESWKNKRLFNEMRTELSELWKAYRDEIGSIEKEIESLKSRGDSRGNEKRIKEFGRELSDLRLEAVRDQIRFLEKQIDPINKLLKDSSEGVVKWFWDLKLRKCQEELSTLKTERHKLIESRQKGFLWPDIPSKKPFKFDDTMPAGDPSGQKFLSKLRGMLQSLNNYSEDAYLLVLVKFLRNYYESPLVNNQKIKTLVDKFVSEKVGSLSLLEGCFITLAMYSLAKQPQKGHPDTEEELKEKGYDFLHQWKAFWGGEQVPSLFDIDFCGPNQDGDCLNILFNDINIRQVGLKGPLWERLMKEADLQHLVDEVLYGEGTDQFDSTIPGKDINPMDYPGQDFLSKLRAMVQWVHVHPQNEKQNGVLFVFSQFLEKARKSEFAKDPEIKAILDLFPAKKELPKFIADEGKGIANQISRIEMDRIVRKVGSKSNLLLLLMLLILLRRDSDDNMQLSGYGDLSEWLKDRVSEMNGVMADWSKGEFANNQDARAFVSHLIWLKKKGEDPAAVNIGKLVGPQVDAILGLKVEVDGKKWTIKQIYEDERGNVDKALNSLQPDPKGEKATHPAYTTITNSLKQIAGAFTEQSQVVSAMISQVSNQIKLGNNVLNKYLTDDVVNPIKNIISRFKTA